MHAYDNQLANTAAARMKKGLPSNAGPVSQLDDYYVINTNPHFSMNKRTLCQKSFTDFIYVTNVTEVKAYLNGLYRVVYDSIDKIYGDERQILNKSHRVIYKTMKDKKKIIFEIFSHYRPYLI